MAKEFERMECGTTIRLAGRGHGFDGAMWDPVITATFDRVSRFWRNNSDHRRDASRCLIVGADR